MKSILQILPLLVALSATGCHAEKPNDTPPAPPPNVKFRGDADTGHAMKALKDDWGQYWSKHMVDMAKLSGRVFNGGHHDQGSAYGTISDGAMNIQNEIKLLTREELFVTLITEDANRLFAAQILYDYYTRFNEDIIQPQIAAFKEQADNLTALGTEDAPIIQREFIEALERFNKEFIVVRTA